MGWKTNCTKGLFPIKCESSLKRAALNTEVILIAKCCVRKITRKRPESAMANFLPIDEAIKVISFQFV